MVINKVHKNRKLKTKAFLNAVEKHFSFLKDYGYQFKEAKIATQYVVDDIIEVYYQNNYINRLIVIHYEPIDIDENIVDLVTVYLYNETQFMLEKNKLEFDVYLKKYAKEISLEPLNYPNKNNEKSFKENIDISVSGYAYYLKDIGANLLNGIEWEEGLTFDWSSAEDMLYQAQKDTIYGKESDNGVDNENEKDDDSCQK